MTTTPPPFDDLQLSAALDDDVDAEVAARIEQDPEARVRLDQLRTARDLVAAATVDPLPRATVEHLLTTALGAADADTDTGEAGPAPTAPAVVAPSPGRRPGSAPAWLVAAVVLVLMGVGLTLVYAGRDDDTEVAVSEVGQSVDESADGGAGARTDAETGAPDGPDTGSAAAAEAEAPEPDGAATEGAGTDDAPTATTLSPTGAPVLVPLGSFTDADALRVHLRDGFPTPAAGSEPATETDLDAAFRCLGKIDGMFGTGSEPVHVGLATVAEEPTVVYELPYRTDDGRDTTLVVAVGELTCIPSLSFQR
jgi:hypothetical protein